MSETVALEGYRTFPLTGFAVAPTLMGQSHTFPFSGYEVSIQLPPEHEVKDKPEEDAKATVNAYKLIDGEEHPLYFRVWEVRIVVAGDFAQQLPAGYMAEKVIKANWLREETRRALDSTASKVARVAEQALEYWLTHLRYATGNPNIGAGNFVEDEVVASAVLRNRFSKKQVWEGPNVVIVKTADPVLIEQWEVVGERLKRGEAIPLHYEFLFAAKQHLGTGELHRAAVEAALSAEILLRHLVANRLPKGLPTSLRNQLENVKVREIIDKYIPDALNVNLWKRKSDEKEDKKKLRALFNVRNDLAHRGHHDRLDDYLCKDLIDTAERIIRLSAPLLGEGPTDGTPIEQLRIGSIQLGSQTLFFTPRR